MVKLDIAHKRVRDRLIRILGDDMNADLSTRTVWSSALYYLESFFYYLGVAILLILLIPMIIGILIMSFIDDNF